MNPLAGTEGDEDSVQDGIKHEAKEVRAEAQILEAETHGAEEETKAHAGKSDAAVEMSGLYDVLNAAGALVAAAKEALSTAPAKSDLRSLLRNAVENAAGTVDDMSEFIRQSLTAGHSETTPQKDQKSSK
jgi:hypothetical protein